MSTEKREKLCRKIDIHSGLHIPGTRKEQALLFVADIKLNKQMRHNGHKTRTPNVNILQVTQSPSMMRFPCRKIPV